MGLINKIAAIVMGGKCCSGSSAELGENDLPLNAGQVMEGLGCKLLIIIPSCMKNIGKVDAARASWIKDLSIFGVKHYFVIGKEDIDRAFVSGDILYVPCRDDYESLLMKLVCAYDYAMKFEQFDYVYKIDDDCFVSVIKLVRDIVPQLSGGAYYGGAVHPKGKKMNSKWHFGKCGDARFDVPYKYDVAPFDFAKGGYGYFLSREALLKIVNMADEIRSDLDKFCYDYEDVRIAEILNQSDIRVCALEKYTYVKHEIRKIGQNLLVYDIR